MIRPSAPARPRGAPVPGVAAVHGAWDAGRMLDDDLRRAVAARFETDQVPLLRRLVEAPSHTAAKDDVEACARLLDDEAARLGLTTTRRPDPSGRFADHRVYATPATTEDDRALLLVGHVDTVFPRSTGFLSFRREGDAVYGPGVLDMKSGLTSVLAALDAIRVVAPDAWRALKVRFVVVTDEEVGSPSSAALHGELAARTTAALVFEAGRDKDEIVVARKGSGGFKLTARGRAAHAGNKHEDGVNAIHALALAIPRIEELTDYARGTTVNVGIVEGGTAKNTVPDHASCTIDARFTTAAEATRLQDELQRLASATLPGRLAAARYELTGGVSRPPMEPSSATQSLRAHYERHAAAVGLGVGEAPLQGGGSDANLLAAAGVAVIDGLGPWGKHFHKVEETSSLSSLLKRTQALATFLVDAAAFVP